ncbi:hypothetical protein C8R44DRAFT_262568 [Mycena epipterygia]|nr:hypothetical protein C8R44DRAFT_262568 [Mycena epipterygia]
MKASFKSWSSPRPQATRLKRSTRPPTEAKKASIQSDEDTGDHSTPRKTGHPTTNDADPGFMSARSRASRRVDGRDSDARTSVSVNRFGWPLTSSRRSGKGSCSTVSVAARAEASAVNDCRPPRSRPSFEVDLSPIIEDIHSFPSLGNVHSSFDSFSMLPDQSITNGGYQEQGYQDHDSRNFDHMNLSGSFVLQSTSCRDIRD